MPLLPKGSKSGSIAPCYNGELFLQKMISFVKDGGLIVSIECNREFEADGLYIRGMEYDKLCRHEGLSKLWKTELERQNRDYSIAMKVPHPKHQDLCFHMVGNKKNIIYYDGQTCGI